MRLQGITSTTAVWPDKAGDTRALAGNSMSLCLVEPLLRNALIACGHDKASIIDRWGTGAAQADLVSDAWSDGVLVSIVNELPDIVSTHLREHNTVGQTTATPSRATSGVERPSLESRLEYNNDRLDDNFKLYKVSLRQHERALSNAEFSNGGRNQDGAGDDNCANSGGEPPLIGSDLAPAPVLCYPSANVDPVFASAPIHSTLNHLRPETTGHTDPRDAFDISGERRASDSRFGADPFADLFLRSEPHAENVTPAGLVASNLSLLLSGDSTIATFARRWAHGPPAAAGRQRDLFPLPPRGTSSDPRLLFCVH